MSPASGPSSFVRPQPFKVLVFASVPPPVHGQNVMVAALLASLVNDPRFIVRHVNPALSSTHEEVGKWQTAKFIRLLRACARALAHRVHEGSFALYYVPAPGKRAALFRDWAVMMLCRPFFSHLILHWHAVGLGQWLDTRSGKLERKTTNWLLGHADLSIVLNKSLQEDAERLHPKRVAEVANGIGDPAPDWTPKKREVGPLRCLFLGLCSEEKGLFQLTKALDIANTKSDALPFQLTVAGSFANDIERARFLEWSGQRANWVQYVGAVSGDAKKKAFRDADVFCFPTHYPHEGQPLTVLEALAFDLPVIATRWRAIPAMLPSDGVWLVEPGSPAELASALIEASARQWQQGTRRAHFLAHFTIQQHSEALATALLTLDCEHSLSKGST